MSRAIQEHVYIGVSGVSSIKQASVTPQTNTQTSSGTRIFNITNSHGPIKVLLIIGLTGTLDSWGPQIKRWMLDIEAIPAVWSCALLMIGVLIHIHDLNSASKQDTWCYSKMQNPMQQYCVLHQKKREKERTVPSCQKYRSISKREKGTFLLGVST
ncbi:hypothetical protein Cgig2_010910 [Carnegiea gigantea]|uniref:Uncharacterized protein n=1 Tax=Carnegiea gigantea TaxID=171969 RepID=A0A9Q1JJT1_9CARY|nr:hypothetical protein Cgig2_010910 [Carnegiea gigantea]